MTKKQSENKWKSVKVMLNGKELTEIKPLKYKEKDKLFFEGQVKLHTIEFDNQKEFIKQIKGLGIELHYGVKENPVSFSKPNNLEVDELNDFLYLISKIKRTDWLSH